MLALFGLAACGQSALHSTAADEPTSTASPTGTPDRATSRQQAADAVVVSQAKRAGAAADCAGLLTTRELRILTGVPVRPRETPTPGGGPNGCSWILSPGAGAAGGFVSVAVTVDDSVRKAAAGVVVRPTTVEGNTGRQLTRRLGDVRACSYYVRLNDKPPARVGSTLAVTTVVREPAPKAFCPIAHRLAEIAFEHLPNA